MDSNAHYQDASERYTSGEFATLEEAVAKAERIVSEDLAGMFETGMSAH